MKRIWLDIPEEVDKQLKQLALDSGTSRAKVLQTAIDEYLNATRKSAKPQPKQTARSK